MNNNKFYRNTKPENYANILKNDGIIFDYWSLITSKFKKIKRINKKARYFEL